MCTEKCALKKMKTLFLTNKTFNAKMLSVSHLARRFTVVMLFLIISAGAFAGNYSQLWKQYRAFAYKG